jgi:hypothetical protein
MWWIQYSLADQEAAKSCSLAVRSSAINITICFWRGVRCEAPLDENGIRSMKSLPFVQAAKEGNPFSDKRVGLPEPGI